MRLRSFPIQRYVLDGLTWCVPNDVIELPDAPSELATALADGGAVAWEQPVSITTYEPAEADRYPMFLDRRVYQGSSGRVYPIPFTDRIAVDGEKREWAAIHLENKWIRLMVLPELGGRIHIGFDKIAGYDFFYRNNVIKPALVGLAGPWISGGVEFNWPQHHRPATFLPVEYEIEQHPDGAVTVWCSDHDPFTRMKGMHGIRLYPDRAVVEVVVRLHNRTSETQTFLWWANAAAAVHDDYQSFFPTDVRFVADHARRAITAFPAADRSYYGVDYPVLATTGGDRLDFYKNIPVPTSYMVVETADDFFGGYDHTAEAGFVHVADRHIAPGKKQWTWGNSSFGYAWDSLLTDHDGPYVELMAGVYTDNQPDFAWLQPGETKSFTQSWMPIQRIGVVHQANLEAAVHLEVHDGLADIGVCVTRERRDVKITLTAGTEVVHEWRGDLEPGRPVIGQYSVGPREPVDVELIVSQDESVLLRWRPRPVGDPIEPAVATEPPLPADIDSVDELYLTGVHLAQYRHPTRSPLPYWEEALGRDPSDARSNLAVADDAYRRGLYESAERHIRVALRRLNTRNSNPRDGEVSYLLGLTLVRLARPHEAIDAFSKAAWDGRWAAPALLEAARLHAQLDKLVEALDYVERACLQTSDDSRVAILRAVILRQLGRFTEADRVLAVTLEVDPLDQTARALVGKSPSDDPRTLIDVALDLRRAGASDLALEFLERAASHEPNGAGEVRPMAHYHRAVVLELLGRSEEADQARHEARRVNDTRCFPSGLDDYDALQSALIADPLDTRAMSLLATLLVDRGRRSEALDLWRRANLGGLQDATSFRNAAITAYEVEGDPVEAFSLYQSALAIRPTDARLWYESDQLLSRIGTPASDRLSRLEEQWQVVMERDDAVVQYCELLTAEGRAQEVIAIMERRRFAPWEGGEGRTIDAWESAHLALATTALEEGDGEKALRYSTQALNAPSSLGEARHPLSSKEKILRIQASALSAIGRDHDAAATRAVADREPKALTTDPTDPIDYFATSLPELQLFGPRLRSARLRRT